MRMPSPKLMEARQAYNESDFHKAARLMRDLVKESPNDADMLFRLGVCEMNLSRIPEARAAIEKALKIRPNQPDYYCALAGVSRREGKVLRAEKEIDKAIAADPKHEGALKLKAEIRFFLDDAKGACEIIDSANARGITSPSLDIAFGLFCASMGREREGIERLEALAARLDLHPRVQATLLFRLGALYDKTKNHDKAWETFVRANAIRKPRFNPVLSRAAHEATIANWDAGTVARVPRAKRSGERCVFIVGMPRSGTSLVEQIIATHPKAYGAGELADLIMICNSLGLTEFPGSGQVHHPERLSQLAVDDAAKRYHDVIQRLAPGATRVTDKNPFNYQHVGMMHVLFPGCRVIWCRRNPIDVCVSNYFQDFQDSIPFATELDHIAMIYKLHERAMNHWQKLFPDMIMELHYDDLVDQQEAKTRELLRFVGLAWDESCLRFYESDRVTVTASNDQVRKPLYKSTGRYAPYEKHLVKLRKDLGLPAYAPAGS